MRYGLIIATVILLICTAVPGEAWLYDAGGAQHLGVSICKDLWVAAPFTVQSDCYATTLGAAIARGFGPAGAGLDAYLTSTLSGLPGSAIARLSQPLIPQNTQYVYYYGSLSEPVLLKAGTIYSVVMVPTTPEFLCSVSWGVKPGTYYGKGSSEFGKDWYQLSYPICVRVDGCAVPEPSVMAGLILSLLGLVAQKRKMRM